MPRIILDGCNTERVVESISVDVKVKFQKGFYKDYPERAKEKMKLLEEQFGEVLKKWFDMDYSSEILSNHEYNCKMNNY